MNDSLYYEMLTPEQKRVVIDIARLAPHMSIGKVAKMFVQCGGNERLLKSRLDATFAIKHGGDRK